MIAISFKEFISESINDAGIFKAIFIIGLPGAGKSYTLKKLVGTVSPRIVNTDVAAEHLINKFDVPINADTWDIVFKDKTHKMTKIALFQYLNGVLPLFIDGTSNDASNILHRMGIIESLGYDVGIIHVNVPVDLAIERAKKRAKILKRHVDEDFIRAVYARSDENVKFLKSKVSFFKEFKNINAELSDAELYTLFKKTQAFFNESLKNPIGQRTQDSMREKGEKYLTPNIISEDLLKKKVDGWYKS